MPAPLYAVPVSAVSLTASTPKTVIGVKAHANSGLILKKLRVSFNSVTAADQPPLIEVCYCTWATNSPGTASTSVTPLQVLGRVIAAQFTAAKTWTTEPTALTPGDPIYVPPNGGAMYDVPLADEWDCALAEGFAIRVSPGASATAMSFSGALYVSRC